jgi:hypothetical protein
MVHQPMDARRTVDLIPLSLPEGPAGFCTTKSHLFFAGAKAVKPPTPGTPGRGRLHSAIRWWSPALPTNAPMTLRDPGSLICRKQTERLPDASENLQLKTSNAL